MTMTEIPDIKEAKRKLFFELIKCHEQYLEENEVEIMYLLSKDRDIQYVIERAIKIREENVGRNWDLL